MMERKEGVYQSRFIHIVVVSTFQIANCFVQCAANTMWVIALSLSIHRDREEGGRDISIISGYGGAFESPAAPTWRDAAGRS